MEIITWCTCVKSFARRKLKRRLSGNQDNTQHGHSDEDVVSTAFFPQNLVCIFTVLFVFFYRVALNGPETNQQMQLAVTNWQ